MVAVCSAVRSGVGLAESPLFPLFVDDCLLINPRFGSSLFMKAVAACFPSRVLCIVVAVFA